MSISKPEKMPKKTSKASLKTGPAVKPTVDKTAANIIAPNTIIKITIAKSVVKTTYQKILVKLAKTTATPGFRKGKAPLEIAEDVIGRNKLIEKTFNEVVAHEYYHAIVEQKKQTLTQPEFDPISLDMTKDWEVEAHFAQRPEIKLGDYAKLVKTALKTAEKELADHLKNAPQDHEHKPEELAAEDREIKLRQIFKILVETIRPAIQEMLLRQETRFELDDLIKNLDQLKLKIEDYIAKRQITTQDLSNELAATALGKLQLEFILGAIATDLKIEVTEAEGDKVLNDIKDEATRAKVKADRDTMRQLEVSLIRQKVIEALLKL